MKNKFRPIVASSLVVALGMSVAVASTGFYQNTGDLENPVQGSQVSGLTGISFGDTNIDGKSYKTILGDSTAKTSVKIFFNASQNEWTPSRSQIDLGQDTILSSDIGLAFGSSSSLGTLTVDMWANPGYSGARSFILDLSSVASDTYALYGNLSVTGSEGSSSNYREKIFLGKFGGVGIRGSITLGASGNTQLVFGNNAQIGGGLTIQRGTNTVVFENTGTTTINSGIAVSGGTNTISSAGSLTLSSGGFNLTGGTTNLNVNGDFLAVRNNDVITGSNSGILNITANNVTLKRSNGGTSPWLQGSSQVNITLKDNGSFATKQNNNTISPIALDGSSILSLTFEGNGTISSNYSTNGGGGTAKFIMGNSNSTTGTHTVDFSGSFALGSRKNIFTFNADNFTFTKSGGGFAPNFSTSKNHEINFNADSGVLGITAGMQVSGSGSLITSSTASTKNISNTINDSYTISGGTNTLNFTGTADYGTTLNIGNAGASAFTLSGGTNNINIKSGGSHTLKASAFTLSGGTNNITFANTATDDNASGAVTSFKLEMTTQGLSISGMTNNVNFNNIAGSTLDLGGGDYTVANGTNNINITSGSNTIALKSFTQSDGVNNIALSSGTSLTLQTSIATQPQPSPTEDYVVSGGTSTAILNGATFRITNASNGNVAGNGNIKINGGTSAINITGNGTLDIARLSVEGGTNAITLTNASDSLAITGADGIFVGNGANTITFGNGGTLSINEGNGFITINGTGSNTINAIGETNLDAKLSLYAGSNEFALNNATLTAKDIVVEGGTNTFTVSSGDNIFNTTNFDLKSDNFSTPSNIFTFNSTTASTLTFNSANTLASLSITDNITNQINFTGEGGGTLNLNSITLNNSSPTASNTITVTNGANIINADWTLTKGVNQFVFDNASGGSSLTLSISELALGANVTNNINFTGAGGGTLTLGNGNGLITVNDGGRNTIAVSNGNNTIQGMINISGTGSSEIDFKGTGGTLAITGGITLNSGSSNITAEQNANGVLSTGLRVLGGTNTINLNKGSELQLGTSLSATQGLAISGGTTTINFNNNDDVASDTAATLSGFVYINGGINTINLNGTGGTQAVDYSGNVVSHLKTAIVLSGGENIINFNENYQTLTAPKTDASGQVIGAVTQGDGTTLTVNFGKAFPQGGMPAIATTGGVLSANLYALDGGVNTINVGSSGNAIDGTITASSSTADTKGGENHIVFHQNDLSLTFNGNLTANRSGKNIIELASGVNSIAFVGDMITEGQNVTFGVGGNYFEIGDNQSFTFGTLTANSGVNRVRFEGTNGTLKGDSFSVTSDAPIDNSGINRFVLGKDDGTYAGNGTYTISKNTQSTVTFNADKYGINAFMIQSGDTTINTFTSSDAQLVFAGTDVHNAIIGASSITNYGNVFRLADGANLSILDGASVKAKLDTQSGKTIFFLEGTTASLKADIYADKQSAGGVGENIFRFSQKNSTLDLKDSSIVANKNASNIFEISQIETKITTDSKDLTLAGSVASGENGGNIISFIANNSNLVIGDGISKQKIQTIDGFTQIQFNADGSTLSANLETIKGVAQIQLNAENSLNTLDGIITTDSTSGGSASTAIIFNKDNATLALSQAQFEAKTTLDTNTIQANAQGSTLKISGANDLTLLGAGSNTITINNGNLRVIDSNEAQTGFQATAGSTHIYLNDGVLLSDYNITGAGNIISATGNSAIAGALTLENGSNTVNLSTAGTSLTLDSYTVNNGANAINFKGRNATLGGNIALKDGNTTITVEANAAGTSGDIATNTISGNLAITGGTNVINLNASYSDLDIIGELTITGGSNTINFDANAQHATLHTANLTTSAGTTTINFDGENNTLSGDVIAKTGATNQINVSKTRNAIAGNILADGGVNVIEFKDSNLTLDFEGILTAQDGGSNTVKAMAGKSGMSFATDMQVTGDDNALSKNIFEVGANQTLNFYDGSKNTTLTALGGVAEIDFKTGATGFKGNLQANGGNTQVTFEAAGTYSFDAMLTATKGDNTIILAGDTTFTTDGITFEGENGVNILDAKTFSLSVQDGSSSAQDLSTLSGKTQINLANTLTGNVKTSGGVATLNISNSAAITGTLGAYDDGSSIGNNLVALANGSTLDVTATTLKTSGKAANTFVLDGTSAKLKTQATLSLTDNNTNFTIKQGTLDIMSASSGDGVVSVNSGANTLFTLAGTSANKAVLNAKTLNVTGGVNTFVIQGDSEVKAAISVASGENIISLSNNASLALNSLTLNGATAKNTIRIAGAGSYALTSGTITLTSGTSAIEFDNLSQSATFTSTTPIATSADLASEINFNSDYATLKADINVAAGKNTINLTQQGSSNNSIDGTLTVSGTGENTFNLGGGTLNINKFAMSGGSNAITISEAGESYIKATTLELTGGENTITFTAGSNGATAGIHAGDSKVLAISGTKNTINFNGGGATLDNTININADNALNTINVSAQDNADNVISGGINVTKGSNIINFAGGGSLATDLTTKGGTSTINFNGSSANLGGNVVADGTSGINTINVNGSGNQIDGTISAKNGGNNNIIFQASNLTLDFSGNLTASGTGSKNTISMIGDQTVATFADMSVEASNGGENIFEIALNQTLQFLGAGGKKTLSAKTIAQPQSRAAISALPTAAVISFTGSTGSFVGNLEANGANTEMRFASEGGKYTIDTTLIATNGSNTVIADKDLILSGAISAKGEGESQNIINIASSKSLSLDALNTQSGNTNVKLGESSKLAVNISTTGGDLSFDTTSIKNAKNLAVIEGVIGASRSGVNTLSADNLAKMDLNAVSFVASENGKNIFDVKNDTNFDSALNLNGQNVVSGGNIFNLGNGVTLGATNGINTQSGYTRINLEGTTATINAQLNVGGSDTQAGYQEINLSGNTLTISQATINVGNNGVSIINSNASEGNAVNTIVAANGLKFDMDTFGRSVINLNDKLKISDGTSVSDLIFNGGSAVINVNQDSQLDVKSIDSNAKTTINLKGENRAFSSSNVLTDAQGSTTIALLDKGQTLTLSSIDGDGSNLIDITAADATLKIDTIKNTSIALSDNASLNLETTAINATLEATGSNATFLSALSLGSTDTLDVNVKKDASIKFVSAISGAQGNLNLNLSQNAQATLGESSVLDQVNFTDNNAVLFLQGANTTIDTLSNIDSVNSQNFVSLANSASTLQRINTVENRSELRNLTINQLNGEGINFVVYAGKSGADKIVINGGSNPSSTDNYTLGVAFANGVNINDFVYNKNFNSTPTSNVAVAQVANSSGVDFNSTSTQVLGFDVVSVNFVKENDGNTTTYYIGQAVSEGAIEADQIAASTAVGINYDLYMANFNSLNKRMGELRENPHSQGAWARVFTGAQSNTNGLGSKTNYTTVQAGYDYAFGFEGANNYLGLALSYAFSNSKTDSKAIDTLNQVRDVNSISSSAVEVALYNAYVSDSGWYNDTIAKFSYLMSSFDIEGSDVAIASDTTNYAITLSDEVGYRFNAGESNEWNITPQLEVAFGYFNQSDFNQSLGAYNLQTTADDLLTLRTRAGISLGYDFKKFTANTGFNASVYVGTFYEYDYIQGGDLSFTTGFSNTDRSSALSSDDRVVLNVGTNMTIKDNTRIYFDFEKSFDGKITTDYQVNVGVRYSFGESNGYAPAVEKAEFKAPLKVEDNQEETTKENKEENNEEGKEETKEN